MGDTVEETTNDTRTTGHSHAKEIFKLINK